MCPDRLLKSSLVEVLLRIRSQLVRCSSACGSRPGTAGPTGRPISPLTRRLADEQVSPSCSASISKPKEAISCPHLPRLWSYSAGTCFTIEPCPLDQVQKALAQDGVGIQATPLGYTLITRIQKSQLYGGSRCIHSLDSSNLQDNEE